MIEIRYQLPICTYHQGALPSRQYPLFRATMGEMTISTIILGGPVILFHN